MLSLQVGVVVDVAVQYLILVILITGTLSFGGRRKWHNPAVYASLSTDRTDISRPCLTLSFYSIVREAHKAGLPEVEGDWPTAFQ